MNNLITKNKIIEDFNMTFDFCTRSEFEECKGMTICVVLS